MHTYADTGTYTVTLLVKNYATGCEHTTTKTVRILFEKANFTVTDSVICKNNPVTFTAVGNYVPNIASYDWDFGDGTTAVNPVMAHLHKLANTPCS